MGGDSLWPDAVLKIRAVIPRWKAPSHSVELGPQDPRVLTRRKSVGKPWVKRLEQTHQRLLSAQTAVELYDTAEVLGLEGGLEKQVTTLAIGTRSVAYGVAARAVHRRTTVSDGAVDAHADIAAKAINRLRGQLKQNRDGPFIWSELSRNFLVVGEPKKALRCMQTALQLGKQNGYLYRAATRLLVHIGEPDRALRLLKSARDIKVAPMLLAAEIATSTVMNRSSRYVDTAIALLSSDEGPRRDFSELAAAVGTVELIHGASKRARAQFKRSLAVPTENSLAQAQWANEKDRKIVIPQSAWSTPESHEANTLLMRRGGEWPNALLACARWLADEPFSVRPAFVGSFIGFRPEHNLIAEKFASAGLTADPNSAGLLNNRAVVRAYLGQIEEAMSDIRAATHLDKGRNSAALLATLGLVAFRSGRPEIGRYFYLRSLAWLSHAREWTAVARGFLYMIREELRVHSPDMADYVAMATKIAAAPMANGQPELVGMSTLVLEEAEGLRQRQEQQPDPGQLLLPLEEFEQQEALFHIPDDAKKPLRSAVEYVKLALAGTS